MPATLRFGIDHNTPDTELSRREKYEQMFQRAPAKLLSIDALDVVMQSMNWFYIWTHMDATVEYASHDPSDNTQIYFQRDWSKRGFLYAPYRVCISEPGVGKFYYRVRTLAQLRRVLNHWETMHDRSREVKLWERKE